MLLSNPAKFFLALILVSTVSGGCGFFKSEKERPPAAVSETKSNIPFSIKEPDVFQGEFVSSNGESSTVSFYAKKGEDWRFDFAAGSETSNSIVKTDKMYSISHGKKIYAEMPSEQYPSTDSQFVNDLTYGLLKEAKYTRFEEAGRQGSIVKYKASIGDNAASEVLIYFDESAGIIVREEFSSLKGQSEAGSQPGYIFEIRNLKLDVNDSVFAMPEGYRKVTWNEYLAQIKQKR